MTDVNSENKYIGAFREGRKLGKMNLGIESGDLKIESVWCRLAFFSREKWNQKPHRHSFAELHLCLSGNAKMAVGKEEYPLCEGTLLTVPKKCTHNAFFLSDDYVELVWGMKMPSGKTASEFDAAIASPCVKRVPDTLYNCIDTMIAEARGGGAFGYEIIKCQLTAVFYSLLALYALSENDGADHLKYADGSEIIASVRKFIADNISQNLSVADVARQYNMSERQLRRLCKESSSVTLSELKQEIRHEKITELLAETSLSLRHIAERTGYADEYIMGKFFKKYEGVSPGEYRRSIKKAVRSD